MRVVKSDSPAVDRLQPHNIELEQQVLGAVLTDNDLYHRVGSMVKAEHFYDPVHQEIWKRAVERIERDILASPVTMKTDMANHQGLSELGGSTYIARLAACSVSSFAISDYAVELIELSRRRELLGGFRTVADGFQSGVMDADAGVSSVEMTLAEQEGSRTEPRSMSLLRASHLAVTQANEVYQGGNHGLPTDLPSLDELVVFRPKRYTIVAGATSMGKTSFAVHLAKVAAEHGHGVGFVSLEMPEEDLANRIISIDSRIPYRVMDRPMSDSTFRKYIETAKSQEALPIEIFSEKVRDIPSVLSEAKRLRHKWQPRGDFQGLKLLIIDYIQLMGGRGSNEFHILSRVANDLKHVAKTLDVHVIALAQLDRKIGERDDPRPRLSDLRGSGDLENAPDNVLFLYRPEYYLERSLQGNLDFEKRCDEEALLAEARGRAEIIIAKQRMGALGSCMVECDIGTNRFWERDPDQSQMNL